jgi:hypothetical protein
MTKNAKPLQGEGLNPDDPAVIAAIDLVRWELSLGTLSHRTRPPGPRRQQNWGDLRVYRTVREWLSRS